MTDDTQAGEPTTTAGLAEPATTPRQVPIAKWILGGLGLAGLIALAPFYLSAGLVAPLWAVIVLIAIWVALVAIAILLMVRRRPLWVLLLPVLAAGIWIGGISLGEWLLGWTA